MKYFINLFLIIFSLNLYPQQSIVDSIVFYSDFIILGKDTVNRVNSLNKKEGKWLKYEYNRWLICISSGPEEPWAIIDPIILGEKYFDGIFVFQICEYKNGLKDGTCIEYFENYEIKYIANFEKDELINLIYYNFDGEIIATIKRNNNGNYNFIQNNIINEFTKKEIYSNFEFD